MNPPNRAAHPLVQKLPRLLGCFMLLNALLLFLGLCLQITIPRDLTYPEGAVAWSAWKGARGQPVYEDWRQWPHAFTPYGPALYYPAGWVARLLHTGPLDMTVYLVGRVQSLAALLGICLLTGLLARRAGCRWPVAWVCGFGFAALWPPLFGYTVSFRPDAPMVFWDMLAVWLALGGLAGARRRWAVLGCLWLAAAYKHAGLAAPLVVALLAWRELGPKGLVRWGLVYLGAGLLAAAAFNFTTGGRFFLNLVWANFCGFGVPAFFASPARSGLPGDLDLLLRFLLAAALGCWLLLSPNKPHHLRALGAYIAFSFIFAVLLMTKNGSDLNYLLEPAMLGAVAAAVAYQRWLAPAAGLAWRLKRLLWVLALFLFIWPLFVSLVNNTKGISLARSLTRLTYYRDTLSRLRPPVLLLDNAFVNPYPAAHALADPVFYVIMLGQGRIPPAPLLDRLARREFRLVILSPIARECVFSRPAGKPIARALERYYQLTFQSDILQQWEPRSG